MKPRKETWIIQAGCLTQTLKIYGIKLIAWILNQTGIKKNGANQKALRLRIDYKPLKRSQITRHKKSICNLMKFITKLKDFPKIQKLKI